jgi:hypothetical protein
LQNPANSLYFNRFHPLPATPVMFPPTVGKSGRQQKTDANALDIILQKVQLCNPRPREIESGCRPAYLGYFGTIFPSWQGKSAQNAYFFLYFFSEMIISWPWFLNNLPPPTGVPLIACAPATKQVAGTYMTRQYEQPHVPQVEIPRVFQWHQAVLAGLIAGAVLIIVPRGSPWEGLAFSEPVIMGRYFPGTPVGLVWLIHLALAVVYGLVVCRFVASYRIRRALVTAALAGLALYIANLAVVSLIWHANTRHEIPIIFTHIVFGLITTGAYRGLLRRRVIS